MSEIRKFKNGKIKIHLESSDILSNGEIDENVYYEHMESYEGLSICQINGYQYLVDFQKDLCYYLGSYLMQNPIMIILDVLKSDHRMYLIPESKKKSKSLLQDLENGY